METIYVFAVLAVIIFLGFFAEQLFKKTKIPDVMVLIIIGITIGSYFKWVAAEAFGYGSELFTTFALIFILFQGSLNLDFKNLVRTLPQAFEITFVNFALTVAVVTGIALILKYDPLIALLIGCILGGTSSAVVIPLVNNLNLRDKFSSILTLESAISDVLCIVGTITIIEIIKTGEIVASGIFKTIISSFSLAIVVGMIIGIIWVSLMFHFEVLTHSYLLSIAVMMGLYAFVESPFVEASGAIASLAFGIILGNSKSIHDYFRRDKAPKKDDVKNILLPSTKNFYQELSFIIKTFFFVYLGILIDLSNLIILAFGFVIALAVFIVRPLAIKMCFNGEEFEPKERTYMEILIPKGLAAAVLAGIAVQQEVITGSIGLFTNMILSTVFFSILITSILVFLTDKGKFKTFLPGLYPFQKK